MLELSESARKELNAFFEANPTTEQQIRIYQAMGCGGPRLNIALDSPTDSDVVEKVDTLSFCIDKKLLDEVKSVKIDLSYMGFIVEPEVPLAVPEGMVGGCASCAGCH